MQLINGTLFLNVTARFIYLFIFALSGSVTVIFPFTTIYASLRSHKSGLGIDILILISLLTSYFFSD